MFTQVCSIRTSSIARICRDTPSSCWRRWKMTMLLAMTSAAESALKGSALMNTKKKRKCFASMKSSVRSVMSHLLLATVFRRMALTLESLRALASSYLRELDRQDGFMLLASLQFNSSKKFRKLSDHCKSMRRQMMILPCSSVKRQFSQEMTHECTFSYERASL